MNLWRISHRPGSRAWGASEAWGVSWPPALASALRTLGAVSCFTLASVFGGALHLWPAHLRRALSRQGAAQTAWPSNEDFANTQCSRWSPGILRDSSLPQPPVMLLTSLLGPWNPMTHCSGPMSLILASRSLILLVALEGIYFPTALKLS